MKRYLSQLIGHLLLATPLLFTIVYEANAFDDSKVIHIDYPAWFNSDPFNDLAVLVERAGQQNKKGLFVLFTTQGCSYCDRFIRKSLGDPGISATLQNHFESVGFEIFDDAEMSNPKGEATSIKQFAQDEKVQFSPAFIFYDNEGNRIVSHTGYITPEKFAAVLDYIIGDHYKSARFRDYLASTEQARYKPDQTGRPDDKLTDNPVFSSPPYRLDRSVTPSTIPLVVIFEKTGCPDCTDFHAKVLSKKQVTDTLKEFEVVRLDINDTTTRVVIPDGREITPAQWYDEYQFTQLPALVLFDENETEVVKTDTLVLTQRMMNLLNYVLEKAYKKGWTYQQFARSRGIERKQRQQSN